MRGLVRNRPGKAGSAAGCSAPGNAGAGSGAVPRPAGRYGFGECGDGSGCFRLGRGCGARVERCRARSNLDVVVAVCSATASVCPHCVQNRAALDSVVPQ